MSCVRGVVGPSLQRASKAPHGELEIIGYPAPGDWEQPIAFLYESRCNAAYENTAGTEERAEAISTRWERPLEIFLMALSANPLARSGNLTPTAGIVKAATNRLASVGSPAGVAKSGPAGNGTNDATSVSTIGARNGKATPTPTQEAAPQPSPADMPKKQTTGRKSPYSLELCVDIMKYGHAHGERETLAKFKISHFTFYKIKERLQRLQLSAQKTGQPLPVDLNREDIGLAPKQKGRKLRFSPEKQAEIMRYSETHSVSATLAEHNVSAATFYEIKKRQRVSHPNGVEPQLTRSQSPVSVPQQSSAAEPPLNALTSDWKDLSLALQQRNGHSQ